MKVFARRFRFWPLIIAVAGLLLASARASGMEILLPQGRKVFQTNEWIDISVVRSSPEGLKAGELSLALVGDDGSRLAFNFPVAAGGTAKTEHLHVNGWLLRPATYAVDVAVDGQKLDAATAPKLEVKSHVRQSSFRLVNWGNAREPREQLVQGESSLGYNLFYGGYANDDAGDFMRGGVDWMGCCVMSGGHQMDLRMECDWSDPYVTRGGTRRVVRRAMIDRTRPNVQGVHFYDEPGLTWATDERNKDFNPHRVPAQLRSYEAAFGKPAPDYLKLDPANPDDVARWKHWAVWKLGFMDAAWQESQFGVSQVRPDYLSLTQSQYGWSAFTDGYYYNVVRSLPITSGHGGYHDYGLGIFNPSYFLEVSRARDRWKPCWYLPTWYGNTTADQFRLEQYLSFQTNIQGMITPPDCEPAKNAVPRDGLVESNQLMKKLGPIFTTMKPTKTPVALLYSLSQCIETQAKDRKQNYAHAVPHGLGLPLAYLAGKLIQQQFTPVVDEDVIDGTLASDHQAIVLTSLDYVSPEVKTALEDFAAGGGLVLLTADCKLEIKGGTKLSVAPRMPDQEKIDELMKASKWQELGPYTTVSKQMQGATPLGAAINEQLQKVGIKAPMKSNVPTITVTRQAAGDIEYLFAVNVTPDPNAKNEKGEPVNNGLLATDATLKIPPGIGNPRPVYDAVQGGILFAHDSPDRLPTWQTFKETVVSIWPSPGLEARVRFGPGQMRAFALTARPIGGVKLAQPIVSTDLVLEESPITLTLAASLVDNAGGILSGSSPLHVRVIDPLGATRYELYQATKLGQWSTVLPLAANDPAGEWTIAVRELLSGSESQTKCAYAPPRRARGLAGATRRALFTAGDDKNAFRFARTQSDVTIVAGASDFNAAAAERLTKILTPWGIRCKTMPLAEAMKSRSLTEEEARTWAGLDYAGSGNIKPGDGNGPSLAGFAVQGPVILLGNDKDNEIIAFLLKNRFLPYTPEAGKLPGGGRGMFAWQRDGVGAGQESITLIAHDAEGMAEAVGSFYEAVAGIDPLTRFALPASDELSPAKSAKIAPTATVKTIGIMPDRVDGLKIDGGKVAALSHDGTLTTAETADFVKTAKSTVVTTDYAAQLKALATPVDAGAIAAAQKFVDATRLVKLAIPHGGRTAIACWGGTLEVRDADGKLLSSTMLPQDVTALSSSGGVLYAGLADGQIVEVGLEPPSPAPARSARQK